MDMIYTSEVSFKLRVVRGSYWIYKGVLLLLFQSLKGILAVLCQVDSRLKILSKREL